MMAAQGLDCLRFTRWAWINLRSGLQAADEPNDRENDCEHPEEMEGDGCHRENNASHDPNHDEDHRQKNQYVLHTL